MAPLALLSAVTVCISKKLRCTKVAKWNYSATTHLAPNLQFPTLGTQYSHVGNFHQEARSENCEARSEHSEMRSEHCEVRSEHCEARSEHCEVRSRSSFRCSISSGRVVPFCHLRAPLYFRYTDSCSAR